MDIKAKRSEAQELIKMANHADTIYGDTSVAGKAYRKMSQDIENEISASFKCTCPFPGGVPEKSVSCRVHGSREEA